MTITRAIRIRAVAVIYSIVLAAVAHASYLADRARPLVEASHAEIRSIYLGRIMSRARWDEVLDETLYVIAPKGRWGPEHPAWPAARDALARVMREKSLDRLRTSLRDWVRQAIDERYSLEPDQVAEGAAFYESPGGKVFRDYREKVLAEASYGLPFVIETESHATMQRDLETAKQTLLNLPDEQTQAVYDFNHSKLGELLLGIENNIIADVIGNIMRSEMTGILNEHYDEIARAVREAVPKMPPRSDKAYLGTVTMRADRTLDLEIEYHEGYRSAGTYKLTYAPKDLHWQDVAGDVPGLAPGETRFLYRDQRGHLSDTP